MLCLRSLASIGVLAALAACSSRPSAPAKSPPPSITFVTPAAGAQLHGLVTVTATAAGTGKVSSFRFDAPAALVGVAATLDPTTHTAQLRTEVDLSAFPDGPLTFTVTATDEFGGAASRDLAVVVAQRAPELTIAEPTASAMVSGVVTIAASAVAQPGATIAALELVDPPPGCDADAVADANALTVAWDTTRAPEGPAQLRLRAVDSTGLAADRTLTVTVDNTPFAQVEAFVSAGAPVEGALVEVVALDDATGLPSTGVGASGLLGAGGPTDAGGRALVTLAVENYRGPVRVVARPAAAATLSYVDPAPPTRVVQIPAALTLSSILPSFTTTVASVTAPVTLWTTLADAEVLAYAAGAHRLFPTRHRVAEAAAFTDELFSAHFQASTPRWDLRAAVPVSLTRGPAALDARSYAALPDVALAQLARDLGAAAKVPDVITAPYLVTLLRQDLAADGQLDGKGDAGAQLETAGIPPYAPDEDTLRVRLASALDDFVRSGNNLSGITRETLAGADVFTTISGDVSALFGSRTPGRFDDEGPTVTFAVTQGPSSQAPVGPANLVRGTVRLVVTATDPSGVRAMSLAVDGANVPGDFAATGSTAATFTAALDTPARVDGLATFTITATDARGNRRDASYQVTVDNTGPAIAVAAPLDPSRYSGAIPVEATATDPNGVASCGEITRGAADEDSAPAHYRASWTPAAGTADGALALSFRACDVVGNCTVQAGRALRDTTPPTVTGNGTPAYTSAATITFTATATDAGAGVGTVFATNGARTVTGVLSGTTWTLPGVPLDEGVNTLVLWATDRADSPNGSSARGTTVKVVRDTVRPAPYVVSGGGTYVNETGIQLANASVPPTYVPASTARVDPIAAGVFKVATRLAATTTPLGPAVLEGANPDNIPFIQVAVPTGAAESPVAAATFTVTAGGTSVTHDLLPWKSAAKSTAATSVYDIPLSTTYAPVLGAGAASFDVAITATFTDAAGLTGSTSATVAFNVLGPPLFIEEDTAYATLKDVKGTYEYRLSNGSYHKLWDLSEVSFTNGNVRLVRLKVSNPASAPVALATSYTQSPPTSWTLLERWDLLAAPIDPSFGNPTSCAGPYQPANLRTYLLDGYSTVGCVVTASMGSLATQPYQTCWGSGAARASDPSRAAGTWTSGAFFNACQALNRYPATGTEQARFGAQVAVETFQGPDRSAGETAPPATLGTMRIVPAATATAPGTLVMYVSRPLFAREALPWNAQAADNRYQKMREYYLEASGSGITWVNTGGGSFPILTPRYHRSYVVKKGWDSLVLAYERVNGSVGVTTRGAGANGTAFVGAATTQRAVPISRRIDH